MLIVAFCWVAVFLQIVGLVFLFYHLFRLYLDAKNMPPGQIRLDPGESEEDWDLWNKRLFDQDGE